MDDHSLMVLAIEAADGARRRVAPWPHVGAAILHEGRVVSGATGPYPAGPHGEVAALASLGTDVAPSATLATTLEPCNHHGNTPPCTEAILASGIRRVLVGIEDPDPLVAGTGIARLRAAGVEVVVGVEGAAVERQLGAYLHHRRTGRSRCVVKVAASLDGRIAAADGTSRWITGDAARADAHELRADSQAVVVGSGTALADNPRLTVRNAEGPEPLRPPLRVLLDARGRVEPTGNLADVDQAPTLVITTERAPRTVREAWEARGAEVVVVAHVTGPAGSGVDLVSVFELLGARGVLQVLIEGGAYLHGALLAEGLADRVVAYVANTLLGAGGLAGFGAPTVASIDAAPRLRLIEVRQVGDDVRLEYAPIESALVESGTSSEES